MRQPFLLVKIQAAVFSFLSSFVPLSFFIFLFSSFCLLPHFWCFSLHHGLGVFGMFLNMFIFLGFLSLSCFFSFFSIIFLNVFYVFLLFAYLSFPFSFFFIFLPSFFFCSFFFGCLCLGSGPNNVFNSLSCLVSLSPLCCGTASLKCGAVLFGS